MGDPLYNDNPVVFESLCDLLQLVLDERKTAIRKGYLEPVRTEQLRMQGVGSCSLVHEYRCNNSSLVSWSHHTLAESGIFRKFVENLKSDGTIGALIGKIIATRTSSRLLRPIELFQHVLRRYFRLEKDVTDLVEKDKLLLVWRALLEELCAKTVNATYFAVLENVFIESTTQLPGGVTLQKLSHSDIEDIWNSNFMFKSYYPVIGGAIDRSVLSVSVLLSKAVALDKIVYNGDITNPPVLSDIAPEIFDSFDTIISGIRVLQTAPVRLGPVFVEYDSFFGSNTRYCLREPDGKRMTPKCELSGQQLTHLSVLVERICTIGQEKSKRAKSIIRAIRRQGYANTRSIDDDRLIDIIIALEALLLTSTSSAEDRGELKLRLSLRSAMLLGKNAVTRRTIFDTVGKAYVARSKVVHGGELTSDDKIVIDKVSDVCRKVILALIELEITNEKVDWDELLFPVD